MKSGKVHLGYTFIKICSAYLLQVFGCVFCFQLFGVFLFVFLCGFWFGCFGFVLVFFSKYSLISIVPAIEVEDDNNFLKRLLLIACIACS